VNKPKTLDLGLEYISTDPYYDAFQLYYQPVGNMLQGGLPNATGFALLPAFTYINFGYQLHDSQHYLNNKQGIRFRGVYRFSGGNGKFDLGLGFLTQAEASAPHRDINDTYTGMKPGFIDSGFGILASNNLTGANALIYETPKGTANYIQGGIEYKFAPSPLKASARYFNLKLRRDSGFASNTAVAMQNEVDLDYTQLKLKLAYAFSDKFSLHGGYNYASVSGYHPGVNDVNAIAGTDVINQYQVVPFLGFDYDIGKNTRWTCDFRYYNTVDKLSRNFRDRSPESFDGIQVMTQFSVKF